MYINGIVYVGHMQYVATFSSIYYFSLVTHSVSKPLSFQYNTMSSDEEDVQTAGMHKVRVLL